MRTGESLLMTVEEAAKLLDVSPRTITGLVLTGQWIGSRKVGSRYVIGRAAFERHYLDGIVTEVQPQRSPFLRTIKAAS